MRQSVFDYIGSLNTLIAVFIGAILATGGALVAEIIQERMNRKRNERDAARFFGDILLSIDQIISFAFHSQTIGDPWGTLTIRLYKTALKEANVYERNRERLFDITDMHLRSKIHKHFLTETFPIDALIENTENITRLQSSLTDGRKISKTQITRIQEQIKELQMTRETGLDALAREHAKTGALCKELEKIAQIKFNLASGQGTDGG